jgi:hypothetical protein
MAAAIAIGAPGTNAPGSAAAVALASAALPSLIAGEGLAASSAQRRTAGMSKTANAAVENIRTLNLIVASRTACRDSLSISSPQKPDTNAARQFHLQNTASPETD